MSIHAGQIYDDFVKHIDAMTDEELLESLRRAKEMTAGFDDDWPDDLVQVVRCKVCKWRNTSGCIAKWPVVVDDDGYCYGGEK